MNTRNLVLVLFIAIASLALAAGCGGTDGDASPTDPGTPSGPGTPTDPGTPTGPPGEMPEMPSAQQLKADVDRETSAASEADLTELVADHTSFALWMYQQALTDLDAGDNFLFSPMSISTAFAMLWPGGVGETADEIAAMLHFGMEADRFHPAANRLAATLASRNDYVPGADEGDAPILEIVNDLWGMDDYPYVQAYLELLARHYGAGMWIVDFPNAFEQAREDINKYVEYRTRGLIPELLPENSITDRTRLVLTNVIYFKGAWRFPFNPDATQDAPFTDLAGHTASVPMMSGYIDAASYAELDGVQAVELDYVGDGLSMVLILPEEDTFAAWEDALDAAELDAVMDALRPMEGSLAMPRFAFESELDLVPVFMDAGFTIPFTEGAADFSGLSETAIAEGLHVTGAFHKARIILDEEGTEAAAATAIVVGAESAPMETFNVRLDRPFLFVLRDRPTGTILFMGRVVDAAAAQE